MPRDDLQQQIKNIHQEQINTLFEAQREFFATQQTKDLTFRKNNLAKLKGLLHLYESQITDALRLDLGKSAFEAYATEIGIVLEEISLHQKKLKSWAKTKKVSTPLAALPGSSFLKPEPYGNTLIIAPWNYPFQLAIGPLVGAIAAGNCAIIKPSEISTHTENVIQRLINDHFPAEYLAVITGDAHTSKILLEKPFDLIFFTGSPRVGKIVMKAAAENLSKVILELGGKSPVIVDEDVDVQLAAKRIIWGKCINAGQTCIAPDYILVHHRQHKALLAALVEAIKGFYGEDPVKHPDYPRIISQANVVRLAELMKAGNCVFGGAYDEQERSFAPTIIDQPALDSLLMQEEIFGPILPVLVYYHLHEAIAFVNQRPKPLALYLFSGNKRNLKQMTDKISAGGITINDTIMHFTNAKLPFGGVGNSGMGNYHGKASFEAFSHLKPIMKRATWIDIPLRYPPFGNKLNLVKKVLK